MPLEKAGIVELTVDELHDLTVNAKSKTSPDFENVQKYSFGGKTKQGCELQEREKQGYAGPTPVHYDTAESKISVGMTGPTGCSGHAFQVDEFGPLTTIAVDATRHIDGSVFVFLVTYDLRTGEDIIPPLSASVDYSRHLLFCDSGEWFDYGLFISIQGPTGPTGMHATDLSDNLQVLQCKIQNLENQISMLQQQMTQLKKHSHI